MRDSFVTATEKTTLEHVLRRELTGMMYLRRLPFIWLASEVRLVDSAAAKAAHVSYMGFVPSAPHRVVVCVALQVSTRSWQQPPGVRAYGIVT